MKNENTIITHVLRISYHYEGKRPASDIMGSVRVGLVISENSKHYSIQVRTSKNMMRWNAIYEIPVQEKPTGQAGSIRCFCKSHHFNILKHAEKTVCLYYVSLSCHM